MRKLFGGGGGSEPFRKSWHGMNQPRPKLPYYFRASARLKSLDEYEEPYWKGRTRWREDDRATPRGVARETLWWLAAFAIIGAIGGVLWAWFEGEASCVELLGGFKVGWC